MRAELLTIGDEILIGQVVNTNAAWMAQKLNAIGISVYQISSVSDNREHIMQALDQACERAEIILITGGLGPTKDDITKHTLAAYFGTGLKKEPSVLAFIKESFEKRNIGFLPVHESQAMILENSELLFNHLGTAPGMWIAHRGKVIVSMPGVPYEMKGIMDKYVLPRLSEQFKLPRIIHKTLVVTGIAESSLSESLTDFEAELPAHIKLAYLPHFGTVRLRLSGTGTDEKILVSEIDSLANRLTGIIPVANLAATDDLKPEQIIGRALDKLKKTLAVAESCTGGYIAHLITSVPGSSNYFNGSVTAYHNKVKMNLLGVKPETLEAFGAVSEECAVEMALGVKEKLHSDYSVSTTGIAGPGGETPGKPVGLVWIAVAGPGGVRTRSLMANGERINVIERAALNALDMLRRMIRGIE